MEYKFVKNKNRFLTIFIIVFIAGYFLFFSSKVWYPDSGNLVAATKPGTTKTWNDRNVTLLSWDYAEDERMMEVQLEIVNTMLDGIDRYEYEVLDRDNGYLTVEKVLESDDFVVLHIVNVESDWKELSLRMQFPDEQAVEHTQIDYSSECKMYANSKSITKVEQIPVLTAKEYQIARYQKHIDTYETQIASLKSTIKEKQEQITAGEADILKLQEQEYYQTEEQKADTEQIIENARSTIKSLQTEITSAESEISELQERINNTEELIKSYKKGE